MNEARRLYLLCALSALAGAASLAFAPVLVGAALPTSSATEILRAVTAAKPGQIAQVHLTTRRPT